MDERLVRVERFEELKTGMRVVVECFCGSRPMSMLNEFVPAGCISRIGGRTSRDLWLSLPGHVCDGNRLPHGISPETVAVGVVYRFASDLDSDATLAREENPYLSRSVLGTNGKDEVWIERKEKAR